MRAWMVVLFAVAGCAPRPPMPDLCPFDGYCRGACMGSGMMCIAGTGTGCSCSGGCWRVFFDGPCWPRPDTRLPDAPPPLDGPDSVDAPEPMDAELDAPAVDAPIGADVPVALDTDVVLDVPATLDAPVTDTPMTPDAGTPAEATYCVDIFVSNTCEMTVTPTEIDIPADQIAYFCWRNTSRDYPVDVWLSYGGGYTDLAPGATWNERPGHCIGPRAHDEYADITTACSSHRFLIHCL